MINYTFKDVKALAVEIANFFQAKNKKDFKFWFEIVDEIKKEFASPKEVILELLGPSVFSFTREISKKIGLTDLIFYTPADVVPLYLGTEKDWEKIVVKWRLNIQK